MIRTVDPEWAKRLYLQNREDLSNALMQTFGTTLSSRDHALIMGAFIAGAREAAVDLIGPEGVIDH